jgi:hypothetical protein
MNGIVASAVSWIVLWQVLHRIRNLYYVQDHAMVLWWCSVMSASWNDDLLQPNCLVRSKCVTEETYKKITE